MDRLKRAVNSRLKSGQGKMCRWSEEGQDMGKALLPGIVRAKSLSPSTWCRGKERPLFPATGSETRS